VLADVEAEHVQLETTGHRKPRRVRYHVGFLLVHDEPFVRHVTVGRRVTRLEQQVPEVVLGRALGGHAQRDDGVPADRRLNAVLQALIRYRQTELKETIAHVDAVLELLERGGRLEQLPLRVVRQVSRYEVVWVRNEEEFVDGVNGFALVLLL